MARALSLVQSEIDSLRAAIARGQVRVKHGETEITYASVGDMLKALDMLLAETDGLATYPVKQVRFKTSKGFDE